MTARRPSASANSSPRCNRKSGLRGPAEALVTEGEGLVEKDPTGLQAVHQRHEQRAEQIVRHYHRIEAAPGERRGAGAFQVHLDDLDQRIVSKIGKS